MTEISWYFDLKIRVNGSPRTALLSHGFASDTVLKYIQIDSTPQVCSNQAHKEKESRPHDGTYEGTYPFVPPPTYSAPVNHYRCSQFPPAFVGLAARTVPPLRLQC